MMNLFSTSLACYLALSASVDAFTPMRMPSATTRGMALEMAVRPDSSALVEKAMKVTAAYGINSNEARLAWEAVEEVDSSDNSQATAGSLEECDVTEEVSQECLDYGLLLDELNNLRAAMGKQQQKNFSLLDSLKMIKVEAAEGSKVESSDKLTEALEKAKKATEANGVTSKEARLAWEEYEEIASSGLDNAMGVSLLDECSVESSQEICEALEKLGQILPVLQAVNAK